MAQPTATIYLVLISLLFGIVAIFFEPLREIAAQRSTRYGFSLPFAPTSPPIVVNPSQNVTYVGSHSSSVEHFQNIFYAEDTSATNRFAPPVPLKLASGSVIDATKSGAWCPQGTGDVLPFSSRVVNVSENCLSLRIARSRGTNADAKLPVMVWIHGGGHALGSGSDVLYEPDGLVKQAAADGRPIIFVAINYRVGLFGFATSKTLIEAKETNAGLRDQRAALEWVRDNIKAFGGDPKRVTAVGQSVGASDISLHITSFGGKRGVPFQKAIMMSGGPGLNFNTKSDAVANNVTEIAKKIGCVKNGDGQSQGTLQCLREAPFNILTNLSVSTARLARPPFGEGFFYPTYDGDFIQDRPSELMRAGKFVKGIPVIASWVTNDGAWYAPPTTSTDDAVLASFDTWLFGLSKDTKARLLKLYPLKDFEHMVRPDYDGPISPQYYRAAQINRDIIFTCPVMDFAWQYVKNKGVDPSQMRLYEHNATRYAPAFEAMGIPMWRVAHLSDVPFVFNSQHPGGGVDNSASQLALSKTVSQDIVKFVTSGTAEGAWDDPDTWPAAFTNVTRKELKEKFPSNLSIRLFGGPYGTRPVTVSKDTDESLATEAEQSVIREKIFKRCELINSEHMREEAGV